MKHLVLLTAAFGLFTITTGDPNSPGHKATPNLPYYRDNNPGFVLDKHIEDQINAIPTVDKIISISKLEIPYRVDIEDQNDVLFISLSLASDFGSTWRGQVIVRKKRTEKDWSKCRISLKGIGPPPLDQAEEGPPIIEKQKYRANMVVD